MHCILAAQVVVKQCRKRFPGKFKIMDESAVGSEIGSPPASRRGSQLKAKDDFAAAIQTKNDSFASRRDH